MKNRNNKQSSPSELYQAVPVASIMTQSYNPLETQQPTTYSQFNNKIKKNNHILFLGRLSAIFLHFSRRSTIHGLNHVAQAKSAKRRLFWLVTSLIASMGFFVNLYYLFEKFLQNPVLTNVYHDHSGFVYPDFTFCIINPIYFPPQNTQAYKDLMKTIDDFTEFSKIYPSVQLSDYLFMRKKDIYSHPSWSAIIECRYMGAGCKHNHFEIRRLWPYGNCFTFNASLMDGMTRHVMHSMQYNGFRPDFKLVIYKALNKPSGFILDPHNSLAMPSGIMMMIHEAHTFPHISESFMVDSCTQIDLKITTKLHLQSLAKCKPYRETIYYWDSVSEKKTPFLGRQSDCVFNLMQSELAKQCGCQLHTLPVFSEFGHLPFCFGGKYSAKYLAECGETASMNVGQKNLPACYMDLCNHTSYTTVVSHSKFPAVVERNTQRIWLKVLKSMEMNEYSHFNASDLVKFALLKQSNYSTIADAVTAKRYDLLNVDFVEKNFMMLRIVPGSLFMDLVEETEEYPLSRLMSDIGGCVGLWIGASLITIFEFVDLILDFTDASNYKPQPKRQNHSNGHVGHVAPAYSNMFSAPPPHTQPNNQDDSTCHLDLSCSDNADKQSVSEEKQFESPLNISRCGVDNSYLIAPNADTSTSSSYRNHTDDEAESMRKSATENFHLSLDNNNMQILSTTDVITTV